MGSCTPVYSISNKYFHNEQFKTESKSISVHTTRYVKILHTYFLISHPLFQNNLFNSTVWPPTKPQKFSTSFQGDLHNTIWPLTSTSKKISNPFLGEFTKTPAWSLTSTSNSRLILRGIHKTLTISTTFPTSNPSNSPNYGSKGIWAFSRQISPIYKSFLELGLNLISNYYALQQHSQVITKFHSQKFCLLSNSFIKLTFKTQVEFYIMTCQSFNIGTIYLSTVPSFSLTFFLSPLLPFKITYNGFHHFSMLYMLGLIVFVFFLKLFPFYLLERPNKH